MFCAMITGMKLMTRPCIRSKDFSTRIANKIYNVVSMEFRKFSNETENYMSKDLDIKGKLELLKTPFEDGLTCYKFNDCAFCSSNHLKDMQLFINKTTGNFICHKCKIYGSWSTVDKMLNYNKNESIKDGFNLLQESSSYDFKSTWEKLMQNSSDLCKLSDEEFGNVLKEFNLSRFSKQDFKKLHVRISKERNMIYFPIYCQGTVVGYRNLDLFGNSSTFPKTDCPGVISLNHGKQTNSVVLVADLVDFLTLGSLKLNIDIVCLPYGIKTLPQNILPLLENYEKIFLWLGIQSGAWHSSIQFAKKLIEKRCYLIRPTENQASPAKAVQHGQNVKRIIASAKPIWHQFVTTFASLREDVLAEIENIFEVSGVPWKRFPQLTKILRGHRRGELTILTGPTGCGKTTFLSEYSLDLAIQGVNTLWGSFEIKNPRLIRTMLQQYSGLSFAADNLAAFNDWANRFENLPIYFLTFHGQHPIEVVMNAVEHCSYTYDIAHVIIDNVQFMMDLSTDANKYLNRFWSQDLILQCFRRFATVNNCHVTLVIHPRKEMEGVDLGMNSIFGTAKAAQEADNILILQKNPMRHKNYLQICKNRFSGDLGKMPLEFDRVSLRFSKNIEGASAGEESEKDSMEDEKNFDDDFNFEHLRS